MLPDVAADWNLAFKRLIGLDKGISFLARVILVTGDNASGKSLLRRMLNLSFRKLDLEVIHLSQEGRAQSGIIRAVVYGSEEDEATGAISAHILDTGFKQKREKPYVLIYDEPEIGMGEEAQMGAGIFLREKLTVLPEKCEGAVIFTHSRLLVEGVKDVPGLRFVHLGNTYKTVDDWLNRKLVPISPADLVKRGHDNWVRVNDFLTEKKKGTKKA